MNCNSTSSNNKTTTEMIPLPFSLLNIHSSTTCSPLTSPAIRLVYRSAERLIIRLESELALRASACSPPTRTRCLCSAVDHIAHTRTLSLIYYYISIAQGETLVITLLIEPSISVPWSWNYFLRSARRRKKDRTQQ